MNSRIQNQLNMVGSCITVAQSPDYKPSWDGQNPSDFGPDLLALTANHGAITAKHAKALAATGGGADAKAAAEAPLEDIAYTVARALAVHFKKTGDLDRRGKVNFTKSQIVKLRDLVLIDQATAIRDLGTVAVSEPGALGRGVTPDLLASLTTAIEAFQTLLNHPRGQIVNRSTLLKEVETDTAALLDDLRNLDDLVLQFGGTETGKHFIQAWEKARIIVDAGHGPGTPPTPPAPPAPTP